MVWYQLPCHVIVILLTKITAAQNEVADTYHKVHGLYSPAVVFVATININDTYI